MVTITHSMVQANGINLHVAEAGHGPLVVLCHGWPECWYSWRHQLQALAEAGFHAVAPDQRGYGETDSPASVDQYTQHHLVGDIIGLLDALGEDTAVIVGHDWGGPVAWNAALWRPDRIRAVVGLSVPYLPRARTAPPAAADSENMDWAGGLRPTRTMQRAFGDRFFYQLYFQTEGVAEHEFERNIRRTLKMTLYSAAGEGVAARVASGSAGQELPNTAFFLDGMLEPEQLPPWLTEADLDAFVAAFQRSGFRGGLNWYRNIDRNWELAAPYAGAKILQPALFLTGDLDVVYLSMMRAAVDNLEAAVPNLRKKVILPGCGHWTQQERAAEVNAEILSFLRAL